MPNPRPLAQLHWGGGTPNYLNAEERHRLWQAVADRFPLEANLEAGIEVNPERLDRSAVQQLRQLGFNRISFGLQDVDPAVQAAVNRPVPVEQLRAAMGWMREAAFDSVNLDVICGLPLQTPERFAATMREVSSLRPDRVSLFSFAYLPEQLPLQRRIKAEELPPRDQRLQMLENAHGHLLEQGYVAIGMDHFALANDPLAIAAQQGSLHRNFQGYTTRANLDLLGVGLSAISLFPELYTQNSRSLKAYQAVTKQGQLAVDRGLEVKDPMVILRRQIIQELMYHFAVDFTTMAVDGASIFPKEWAICGDLEAEGLLNRHCNSITVTERGRWLIRVISAVFDPDNKEKASGSRVI
jgi:oxygen-independent coproporphyrinogen-3 oxidase